MRSQQGGPKAVICPLSVSEYLLSREDHKKPAFAGVSYLFKKRAIVALFALSSEFNSNCLKPNFCSTRRTIASLVISTFFPFFAFSILFLLNIEHIIQTFLKISIGKSKKDELFLGTFVHFGKPRRFYHTLTSLSRVFSKFHTFL